MYPLRLSANFDGWKLFMARKADHAFQPFSEKVFIRDRYICQFCGFCAKDYQEVINLDQNYRNNKLANLVTACCFCAQCFFIESVGQGDFGGGTLIYLPEIEQTKINSLSHVMFCAMISDNSYRNTAETIYRSILLRSQPVEQQFGEGMSEPSVFGQAIIQTDSVSSDTTREMLKNIRLIPSRNRFRKQIEHWAETAINEIAAEST